MEVTRDYWMTAALGGLLAALSLFYAEPLLLAGAVGVAAWLLAAQYAFARALARTDATLSVSQSVSAARVATDEDVPVTLTATTTEPAPLPLAVTAQPPVTTAAGDATDRSVTLSAGERASETSFTVTPGVAGRVSFDPAEVRATDRLGLFTETLARGETATLIVEPRRPRNLHVGAGGERQVGAYGEHPTDRTGGGLEPAEIRQYVPGDPANRIEWKATARLGDPHVREFQAETDRQTILVLDGRNSLAFGPTGETAFEYLREVALTIAGAARDWGDPIGLYAVGDDGLTAEHPPDSTDVHYGAIMDRLRTVEPTRAPARDQATTRAGQGGPIDPAAARRTADRLAGDESRFASGLEPLLSSADAYVARLSDRPLVATARTRVRRLRGRQWTVLLTDDADRTETLETAKLLRRRDDHVLALLAPRILFEPGGLGNLDAAYDRYREFESYRRTLDRLDRVRALEVGPGDRLATLLATRQLATVGGGR